MKKRWNRMGKMTIYSLIAMMVMAGASFGMTASAEEIIDSDETPAVQEMVPESESKDALPEEAPAEQEDVQETGETDLEVEQVVVIEDEQVPGAAVPEMTGEDAEAEADKDADASEDAETSEDAEAPEEDADAKNEADAEEPQEEKSETGVSGVITYEDSEVAVTIIASEAAQLPADTTVKVTRLAEGSEKYEAAKAAARQSVEAGEDASYTFYDVTLESEGQELDVEAGTVSVKMEFKTDAAKREVVSIEETEGGKIARNVTDRAAVNGRAGSVALSY